VSEPSAEVAMLTVDARCTDKSCSPNIYRMVGKCYNCGAEPVLVMFTERHEKSEVPCPTCGTRRVNVSRLATPDEIPNA
jgi:DNA-directed RNA polymerase subunit RPC12/RpoP